MTASDSEVKSPALTKRAWSVGKLATSHAKSATNPVVDTRHILYALWEEAEAVSGVVLREFGIDQQAMTGWLAAAGPDEDLPRVTRIAPETALSTVGIELDAVRRRVDEVFGSGALDDVDVAPPLGEAAIEVFTRSKDEALGLGHNYIGTEHILLAFTAPADSTSVRRLRSLGLDETLIRGRVLQTVERFHVAIDDDRYRALAHQAQRIREHVDLLELNERKQARSIVETLDREVWQQWAALYPNPAETLFDTELRTRFLAGIQTAIDHALERLAADGVPLSA